MKAPPESETIKSLTGLRGLACLIVLFTHAGWTGWISHAKGAGQFGVMLFFSLSGFLMGHHYLPGSIHVLHWLAFLIRRLFRIYPIAAFVTYILIPALGQEEILKCSNFSCWLVAPLYISWTVIVEVKFYFLFAALGLLFAWLKMNYQSQIIVLGVVYVGFYVQSFHGKIDDLMPYMPFFIGGVLSGCLISNIKFSNLISHIIINRLALGLMALFITTIIFRDGIFIDAGKGPGNKHWYNIWFLSSLSSLLVIVVALSDGLISKILSHRLCVLCGKISYSLFLVHVYVFKYCIVDASCKNLTVFLPLALIFTLSYSTYVLIEHPLTGFGKRISSLIFLLFSDKNLHSSNRQPNDS
jgi:peptidoglycan/LPS O-acetylase OafA/YrhL